MLLDSKDIQHIKQLFNDCSPLFIALGDEVRQKLLLDIAEGETTSENGINVTDLSLKSKLSRPAISHHLKVLKDYGVIVPHKVGTQIFYKISVYDHLQDVTDLVESIRSLVEKIYPEKKYAK